MEKQWHREKRHREQWRVDGRSCHQLAQGETRVEIWDWLETQRLLIVRSAGLFTLEFRVCPSFLLPLSELFIWLPVRAYRKTILGIRPAANASDCDSRTDVLDLA